MKRALAGVGSVAAVVAVAAALLLGSQALRGAHLTTADVIDSPSPTPIAQNCITPDNCPSPEPTCVPGEGTTCDSSPAPIVEPSPTAAPSKPPPVARGVPGQIQAGWWLSIAGKTVGITVSVLYNGNDVAGASVRATCTGPGMDVTVSGTTATRTAWSAESGLNPPSSPDAYFWSVQKADTESGARYTCHGSASYQGLTDSF